MTSNSRRSSARQARPDLAQLSTVLTLGMTAWWLAPARPLSWNAPLAPRRIIGGSGTGMALKAPADPQPGDDARHVRDQALRQVAGLRARIGDDLLALAVIELLRHLQRPGGRPAEARAAQLLQRGQVVQPRRPLPLVLDLDRQRAVEPSAAAAIASASLALDDPLLRRVPHAGTGRPSAWAVGDHLEVGAAARSCGSPARAGRRWPASAS